MGGPSKTVLICDDDQGMRDTIAAILQREYRILSVPNGESALSLLKQEDVDVLLLDVRLPGINGLDVLRIVRENYGFVECIVISAISEVETAVQAMKYGAYHYVTKTFEYEELRSLVRNACEHQDLNRQVAMLSAQVAEGEREFLIGPSRQIRDIVDLVQKVAKLSATVLILGESGTGKELLARLLHRESGRRDAPFIAVNLSAIPHELVESTLFGHERGSFTGAHKQQLGKFELASGGTLFLDEIGDLRLDLQAKLLRAIQEGEIERINVIPIRMPPLRERLDDLPELARLFLERYRVKFRKPVLGIADSAIKILASYWWPGNIRELENLIERLVAVSDKEWITDEDLPMEYHLAKLDSGPAAGETLFQEACDTFERNFILRALEKSDWNVTATARYLG